MILPNHDNENGSDLSAQIQLLNQYTQKCLSVIITKEQFLFSILKFTLLWLDIIFEFTNLFLNLQDGNIIVSDNKIRLKEKSHQYKELVNKTGEKLKQLLVDIAKEIEYRERLCQLWDKYHSETYKLCKKTKVL